MPGKFLRMPLWMITLAIGAVVTTTAAQPQTTGATSNLFGLTIENIYDRGVMVTDVALGSRARQAGILKNDVILEVNGEAVLDTREFQKMLQELGGQPVSLTISRLGQINTFIVDTR